MGKRRLSKKRTAGERKWVVLRGARATMTIDGVMREVEPFVGKSYDLSFDVDVVPAGDIFVTTLDDPELDCRALADVIFQPNPFHPRRRAR